MGKYFSIAFVSAIIVCIVIYAANDIKKQNNILMIAAIYPPNINRESHYFVIKEDGTMEVTKGGYSCSDDHDYFEGMPLEPFLNNNFITDPEITGSVKLSQTDLAKLIELAGELDALGIQAKRGQQYGWYVTAVYYNGKLHESHYTILPYERDSEDKLEYEDTELEEFHLEPPPPEEQMTNGIIDFLLLHSPIPLNKDAWWF